MLKNLTGRLASVVKTLRGQSRLTEENISDALRDVRLALLEADVALPVVKQFIAEVKVHALGQAVLNALSPGQALVGVVHQQLTRLMGEANVALNFATAPPAVILLAGLQGAGKTTTAAKLAKHIQDKYRKKVLLVSTDVYRPAAMTQLAVLANQVGAESFSADASDTPAQIVENALAHARCRFIDVVLIDTAGRLAIDQVMMEEVRHLHQIAQPIETLFVVDAMQGQDAAHTAQGFHAVLPLTGVILTKLDGDARGGAALSVRQVTDRPIKFIGVSEKITGLEPFHPERMASRVLGMGDVLSLIEEAQQLAEHDATQQVMAKLQSGKGFDLTDFKQQLIQMKKLGGVSGLMDKLPAQWTQAAQTQGLQAQWAGRSMNRIEGMIDAMTPLERAQPELLKASRKRRIAAGAGVSVQEVNRLLTQFEQTKKMMKQFGKGGMGKLMRAMGGGKLGQFGGR